MYIEADDPSWKLDWRFVRGRGRQARDNFMQFLASATFCFSDRSNSKLFDKRIGLTIMFLMFWLFGRFGVVSVPFAQSGAWGTILGQHFSSGWKMLEHLSEYRSKVLS